MSSSLIPPNFSSSSQYLLNTKTGIDDVARGKQGGSILTNTSTWTPNALAAPEDSQAQTFDQLPDLPANEENNPIYTTETDLQGTWDGLQPTASDFEANQLNFGATQKTDSQGSLELRQKISMGLKKGNMDTPAPLISGVRRLSETPNYTQKDIAIQLGMTQRDAAGNDVFSVDHTQTFLENGDQTTETTATYQASQELQLNTSYATGKDSNTQTMGFDFSRTKKTPETTTTQEEGGSAADATPKTLSISGKISQANASDTKTSSLTAGAAYGDTSINYAQERIDPTQLTEGLALAQTQQNLSVSTKLGKDLNIGIEQSETIADFLDCDSNGNAVAGHNKTSTQGASLDWQISEATTFGYVHSREILTSSSQSGIVKATESNQFNLKHDFNKNVSGAFSYTQKVNNAEFYSAKLTYTAPASAPPSETAAAQTNPNTAEGVPPSEAEGAYSSVSSKWELGVDQEISKIDPQLNNRRYTLGYATQHPDEGLAMECKYSRFIPQAGQQKWDSSIRVYGDGDQAIPLVAELKMSSEQTSPNFSVTANWHF
jgi:hypothetical protein